MNTELRTKAKNDFDKILFRKFSGNRNEKVKSKNE